MDGPQPTDAASSGEPLEEAVDDGFLGVLLADAAGEHGGETRPDDGDNKDNETHGLVELDGSGFLGVRPGVEAVNHFSFFNYNSA